MASSKPARMITGGKVGRQPSNGTNLAAAVIASATAPATATQGGKSGKNDLSDAEDASPDLSAEELLEQCKCPISLELMRRPVLPSSGQAYDEINLLRWSQSGNTKCPVSGQELVMRKTKMSYTKHHLLRNIIRQQAAKAGVYLPPVEKEALIADVRKPAYTAKALQALFDDRCLGYMEKDVMMRTLKDLVKRKSLNKLAPEVGGAATLLQMVIRCCLATRKGDLVRYGRKLLKDDLELWRDPEVISEVLGLAEDTEHRGDILLDIEAKFTETQVGPKEFVKAVLTHCSEKNPVQRTLDKVASEVLSFKPTAYQAADWTAEDKGELLNMALATLHSQCVDAGVCCTQLGLGSAKWTKALVDLQRLGYGLSKDNLKILFGSPVHSQALQQIAASASRSTLEWHLDQQDSAYVGMLCLDHIALPPQPRAPHHLLTSQIDFQDETSTDDDLEDDEDVDIGDDVALRLNSNQNYGEMEIDAATAELLAGLESESEPSESGGDSSGPQAAEGRQMSQIEADLRARYFSQDASPRARQRRRT